eukprot:g677.t1
MNSPIEIARRLKIEGDEPWKEDKYLLPTLQNDLLLTTNFDQWLGDKNTERDDIKALREENLQLRRELEWLKLDPSTKEEIKLILNDENEMKVDVKPPTVPRDRNRIDSAYFSSYNSVSIHREMLEDKVRVEAYQSAIENQKELFRGKTVLDVGCGTGILSFFVCRAEAKRVIAIDASEWATRMTRCIAEENGYLKNTNSEQLKVICGKLEDCEDHCEAVDIIISEWMGYALLFESMLDTVLYARDKWLKSGGVILPNKANMFIAGASEKALDLDFWKDVYGFSMQSVAKDLHEEAIRRPIIRQVAPEHLLTAPVLIKEFNIASMSVQDTNFTSSFRLERKNSIQQEDECSAIVLWFSVEFSGDYSHQNSVILDTSPSAQPTHWGQTVLALHSPLKCPIEGEISICKADQLRSLDITLHCKSLDEHPPHIQITVHTLSVQN